MRNYFLLQFVPSPLRENYFLRLLLRETEQCINGMKHEGYLFAQAKNFTDLCS